MIWGSEGTGGRKKETKKEEAKELNEYKDHGKT